jgi:hypothetical protein
MDHKQIEITKQTYQQVLGELEQLKKDYMKKVREEGEKALKGAFQSFFEQHPEIEAVAWNQYTPYFNDGDACVFHVRELNFRFKGTSDESYNQFCWGDDHPWYTAWGLGSAAEGRYVEKLPDEVRKLVIDGATKVQAGAKEFASTLNKHEDLFEMTFGDHVTVIATPDKFTVNDCSHD